MATTGKNAVPTVADTLRHPAYPSAVWDLEPTRSGLLPVAEGRGGPFNIHWEVHGEGPIQLALIMGLGSFKSAWQRQTLYFGHERYKEYSVLIFDNRGMGRSDRPFMRYSTSEMALDVLEVLRHVGFVPASAGLGTAPTEPPARTVHVASISMGGMIAQELACVIPEYISTLTLTCTAAAIENTTSFTENMANRANMLIPKSAEVKVHQVAYQIFSPEWLHAQDDADVPSLSTPKVRPPPNGGEYGKFECNYQRVVAGEMHKRLDKELFTTKGFILQLVAAGWHHKTRTQLAAMADVLGRERILIMHGTADEMITPPHGHKLIDYVKPGESYVVEGMGHAPPIERSRWFNSLLERKLADGEKLNREVSDAT